MTKHALIFRVFLKLYSLFMLIIFFYIKKKHLGLKSFKRSVELNVENFLIMVKCHIEFISPVLSWITDRLELS